MSDYTGFDKIIVKDSTEGESRFPLFCPICDLVMNKQADIVAFEKYLCCSACSVCWAEARRQAWSQGWRPKKEDVEKEVQIRKRASLSIQF